MNFSDSLATKSMSLNNEPCITRAFLIDLNFVDLEYYSFMISLDKCNGIFNSVDDLSTKKCVPSKTTHVNVKVLNMITNRNEV